MNKNLERKTLFSPINPVIPIHLSGFLCSANKTFIQFNFQRSLSLLLQLSEYKKFVFHEY